MKIAIVGASGFVGLRLVEQLHLTGRAEVVPVVHTFRSLAVLARFGLPWRVTDPSDPVALGDALKGCDYVVHAALGDATQIVSMAEALYPAAERAGIKRIVALSSASVHSLTPATGTDETTPVLTNQKTEYNAAKANAEVLLENARRRGKVELVQLRPSIIHGPRSKLVADLAQQLLEGTAYLLDEGRGICNAVAVDNLIEAIWASLTKPEADRNSFLVNDRETVTWAEFYSAIAAAVGADMRRVHYIQPPEFRASASQKLARIAAAKPVMATLPLVPARVKRLAKAAAAAWATPGTYSSWTLPEPARPRPTEEICQLQSCRWRYPTAKAEQVLGFTPPISFAESMRRTAAWLEFAGIARRS
jgi:nucleoside-diphosphate-sugar epimerase